MKNTTFCPSNCLCNQIASVFDTEKNWVCSLFLLKNLICLPYSFFTGRSRPNSLPWWEGHACVHLFHNRLARVLGFGPRVVSFGVTLRSCLVAKFINKCCMIFSESWRVILWQWQLQGVNAGSVWHRFVLQAKVLALQACPFISWEEEPTLWREVVIWMRAGLLCCWESQDMWVFLIFFF